MELLSQITPIARKEYDCMACEWLFNILTKDLRQLFNDYSFTLSEKKAIIMARDNDYKIVKGQKYIRQCIKDGGNLSTFIAIPEMHEICWKHDIYDV